MSKTVLSGILGFATLIGTFILYPSWADAYDLTTTIDLDYSYTQTHLGDNITDETDIRQKYTIEYEAAVTPIFDLLASLRVDLEDGSGERIAETSKIAPTLEITLSGPTALLKATYDATITETKEFEETGESEVFANNFLLEFEVTPDYWPEMKLKLERKRDYEEQMTDKVSRIVEFDLRKEMGDLRLEFNLDYAMEEETLPGRSENREIGWSGQIAYQSTVWWDVDVDLTYEIQEVYSETFTRGVFTDEEEDYVHEIQVRLKKSLLLTHRLRADLTYEYEFEQDLLLLEEDYTVSQKLDLEMSYEIFDWLEAGLNLTRETEETINVPPEEPEQTLEDAIELTFDAAPTRWLDITGKAEWEFDRKIAEKTGASIDKEDDATYEISVRHQWGKWWDLVVTGTTEYEYTDDWLTRKEGKVKAELQLSFFEDFHFDTTYELERMDEYEERSSLAFGQSREEEVNFSFEYSKDFSDMIQTAFTHEFGMSWDSELDEVANFEEVVELTEDTRINVALVDFIREMTLEGEITRKASDTRDDEDPLLVDITYALKWQWHIRDLDLEASFKYDDNGDTFDESTFNTKVAWSLDNFDVSGEYQFDKTYSDEVDEERKLNLKMKIEF